MDWKNELDRKFVKIMFGRTNGETKFGKICLEKVQEKYMKYCYN